MKGFSLKKSHFKTKASSMCTCLKVVEISNIKILDKNICKNNPLHLKKMLTIIMSNKKHYLQLKDNQKILPLVLQKIHYNTTMKVALISNGHRCLKSVSLMKLQLVMQEEQFKINNHKKIIVNYSIALIRVFHPLNTSLQNLLKIQKT